MTNVMKKISISIMVAAFVCTACLALTVVPSRIYADSIPYAIGDTGPAGGIIFYVNGSNCLEAAPYDQTVTIDDQVNWITGGGTQIEWVNGVGYGGTSTAVGTGQDNTNAIIAQLYHDTSAAEICNDLILGGHNDWFLPSKDELNKMYLQRDVIGGFRDAGYWSSSEGLIPESSTGAWYQEMGTGTQGIVTKSSWASVRAIRAFSGMKNVTEKPWVRTMPMTCYRVWINEDNKFQFLFWYPCRDNNWVKIYDISGKEVYSIDMPYDNPNIIVDLPDGLYTVKTYNVDPANPIQTFLIGKP